MKTFSDQTNRQVKATSHSVVRTGSTRFLAGIISLLALTHAALTPAFAANLYWDANGNVAGAGGVAPVGTWGTDSFWSTSIPGTAATAAWTSGETAVFSAGNDATGTFTVNVNGTQTAAGVFVEEGNLTLSGGTLALAPGASVQVGASRSLTISSSISGSSWTKAGGGSLSLNSANSFTGPLTITGSAVRFNANGAAGFGSIVVSPTSDVFLQSSVGGVTITNAIVLNSGQNVDVSAQTGSLTLNGAISGGRSLWSVGGQFANTISLGGNNTFSGNVEVNGGTLIVTRDNALGTVGGTTKVASGATLGLQGGFNYISGEVIKLFGDGVGAAGAIKNISGVNQFFGPIDLQSHVTIGGASGSLDLGGTISGGAFNITKVGAGKIIISGLGNTFAATAVNAGTLQVESTLGSGPVTVSALATLAGNGVIAGAVTLSGEMSPASSPGTLTTGAETWNPGASYHWEINEADFGVAGDSIGWDLLDINGTLTINSTSLNPFIVRISSLDPFSNLPSDAGSFDETDDYNFPIASTTGGIIGFNANKFAIDETLFSNFKGVGIFVLELANANNDLVLKFVHPAFITSQPASATNQCGVDNASFTVGAGGSGSLTYQWLSNGIPVVNGGRIAGATSSTLTISPVHLSDSANYSCFITNIYGSTNSAVAVLSVVDTIAPALTCPPTVNAVADLGDCFATGVSLGSPTVGDACDLSPTITNNATASYPVGTNTVTWGATDDSGNHSQCTQLVIVTDTQNPIVVVTPISRALDVNGDYTLTASDIATILAGSTDNCGIATTNLSQTVFNYCNLGTNNVTVTLTDVHSNTANAVVVITLTAPPTPTVVYVDDDYPATCAAVNFPSNGVAGPYYVGFNAFKTIQAGIDAVAAGGTVNVAAGLYAEDLDVDKSVSLIGPNAVINPNTGSRVAEAVIVPASSDPDPFSVTSLAVVYLSANSITISGFTVDGDNTSLTSGIVLRGADLDSIEAIASYEGVGSISISNNILKNTSYAGVDLYNYNNGGAATGNNRIKNNKLNNIGHIPYGYGLGVLIYNNFYAEISGNVMTEVRVGVQTGNFNQNNPGSTASISDNTISSSRRGIFYNLHYTGASLFVISNNSLSVENEIGSTRWDGIMISSQQSSVNVTVVNNQITATPVTQTTVGYQLWNNPTTLGVTISGGTVSGASYGVWLNNYDGYGPSNGDSTTLYLSGVTITNASVAGVYVKDNALNSNGATLHAVLNGNTVIGSTVGLLVDGPDASLAPGNTALTSLSGDYIDLVNNSSSNMNATAVSFDGLTGAGMTLAQLFTTEDRIDHATDTAGLGFVRVKAANVYVTVNSGSIQRGVNPATPGDTVNVNDGTYDAKVSINKTLALLSANGSAVTTIQDSSATGLGTIQIVGPTTGVQIGSSGRGFTVNGIDSPNPGIEFAAVYFQGNHANASVIGNRIVAAGDAGLMTEFGLVTDTMTVSENEFSGQTFIGPNPADVGFGNQFSTWNVPRQLVVISSGPGGASKTNITFTCNSVTGTSGGTNILNQAQGNTLVTIDSVGSTIQNNTFTGVSTRFAESLRVRGPGSIVSGNTFASSSPIGVQIHALASATAHVTNNSFTTSYPIAALVNGGSLLNAQNNWWGNVSGPAHASNPGGLGAVVLGSVDISPWLGTSSDISGSCGFQPNLASVYYAPHHLVFSTQPGNAGINSPFPPQPVVQVIDENNTLATTFNGSVTVVINTGTPGAVLSGGLLTVPVSSGVASFSGLQIDLAGTYTLSAASASPIIGTNSAPFNVSNGVPAIVTLSPPWAVAGDAGFTLTVNGSGFVYDSVVRWAGSDRVTTYFSPTQLTASITAADIASVGFFNVTVFNDAPGGGESAPASFEVKPVPTVVYVDDDYSSTNAGIHLWSYDAFNNVQSGVNRVASGGTVIVAGGSYAQNVLANKPVILLGANQGVAGCGVRGPESTISGGAGIAVDVQSDGVTVDGFALTGAIGLRDVGYELVVVRHNAITAAAVGVDLEGIAPTAVASVIVSNNCVTLTAQLAGPNPTTGVLVAGVSGTASPIIDNNNISAGFFGYLLYDASASVNTVIKGGTVTGVRQGLAVVNAAPPIFPALKPSSFTADGISMSGFAGATTHAGVYVFTGGTNPLAVVTGTIKNLNVTGTGKPLQDSAGIVLGDFSTGAVMRQNIAIENCVITNNLNRGIHVRGSNCFASVTGSILENNGSDPFGLGGNDGFGIVARESSSLFVMESSVANPASVTGGYSVTALAAHTGAQVLAISNSVVNGVWPTARLAHNDGGLSQLNASGNWFGSTSETTIAGLTVGSVDFTPYLDSGLDLNVASGFQGSFATLHVTTLGTQIGSVTRIQEGVDMVSGSTVLVEVGAYHENVVINKKVVVDGVGSIGDTIVTAPNPALPVFLVTNAGGVSAADRLTIKDISVLGGSDGIQVNASSGTRQWYRFENVSAANNSSAGIALTGVATLGEVEVVNSVLINNGVYGLQVADTLATFASLAVSGGTVENNGNRGLAVDGTDANATSPTGISVTGTSFNGNGNSAVNGDGDVSFFLFNGNAALTNVTVTADAQFPIQFRGKGSASPGSWAALGTVRLENVTVSGATTRPGLYIVRYSDVSTVSFENVNLSGLVPPVIPSGFASVMQVQHTGVTPLNLHGLTLQATYVGGPPVGYGALAMLQSGGAIADCTTVILGATTVQQLEGSVYDQQDNAAVGDVVFPALFLTPLSPTVIAECTGGGAATVTFASPTVTAACTPTGPVVSVPASGSIFPLGTNIVTSTVTDNRGISNSTTFAVIVLDTTSPDIISCAPNTNVVADAFCNGITPNLTGMVAATDGCGSGALVVTQSPLAGSSIPLGANPVTLTVTDPSGNFSNCVATVTVIDVTAPTVNFWPTNRTLSVGAGCDALVPNLTVEVLATDSCSPPVIVTQNPIAGTSVGLGLTVVTVTVADQVGNATSNTVALTIVDTSNPSIACPANVSVNRLAATDPYATGFATASDNCTNVTVTYSDNRDSLTNCNATGFIFRTWKATDAASNITTCVQTITVFDTVTPLFTSSQTNITTINDVSNCSAVVSFPMLTAVDVGYNQGFENAAWVSGGYPSIPSVDWNAYSSPISRVTSGTDGIVSKTGGAHAVINSTTVPAFTGAFNRLGGYSSVFGTGFRSSVDVYLDLTDPAVTANTYGWDVSTAANNQAGSHRRDFVFHSASDTNGNILIAASNNSGFTRRNDLGSINHYAVTNSGWYTLEWVFRNNAGVLAVDCNLRNASGTLLWTETRSDPSDLIATVVGGNRYMWFTFLAVNKLAIDNAYLERNAPIVCTPASGSTFAVGSTTVECVASDACGNSTTNSFTVTVNDTEAPSANVPANVVQNNDLGNCSAVVNFTLAGQADNCGVFGQVASPASGSTFAVGVTPVVVVVTDIHGNSATNSFTVTVNDTEAPSANVPANVVQNNDLGNCSAVVNFTLAGQTDNCGVFGQVASPVSGSTFAVGVTPVVVIVTDIHGNSATNSFTVTVNDVQAPTIAVSANIVTTNDVGQCSAVVSYSAPVTADNCGVATTVQTTGLTNGAAFPVGVTVNTFVVTDIHGNSATNSFTVTVNDVQAPTIAVSANIVTTNDVGQCSAVVSYSAPVTADNCGVATTVQTTGLTNGAAFPVGVTVNTFVVTDIHGNSATNSFTVTVNDVQAPTIAVSANIVTTNDVGLCSAVVSYSAPVTADNCGVATTVQTTGLTNGAAFPVGVTVNTFVVTDIHGNSATNSFTVTVNDTQLPMVTAGTIATCYQTSIAAQAAAIAATSASDNCGVASTNILSTVGTCSAVITVRVTDIHGNFADVAYNTRIDPTAPVIGLVTATEIQFGSPVNVKNNDCVTNPVLQGVVLISVAATDNCSFVGGQPSVSLVNGTNNESATFVNESPLGTYNYSWIVTNTTANGTWTATVSASDICHNTTTNFTMCVNKSQVTGLVQLEGFTGTGTNVNHARLVTFVATGGVTNKTWNLTLTNVSGDTFNYALTGVPANTTGISAKTDWNLREKLAVVLDINGQAVANFTGNPLDGWLDAADHYLRGCDISALNPLLRDNQVQFFDYSVLGSNFFTFNSVADVTGDGQVDYDDYLILYLNYFTAGDAQ